MGADITMNNGHPARQWPKSDAKRPRAAYFCMEYGLDDSFKIYSGGLGILAGDLIKAARDADYPMVAVGILWRQGYTSQTIGENGMPVDAFPEYRYPFLDDTGVTVGVTIKEANVRCKVWRCDCFGSIPLYLLDTFLPDNPEQLVTGQLYGWFEEERLAQEIVLGVGGVRALAALGIEPEIYHFNEGHAALAGLELIKREMAADGNAGGATDRNTGGVTGESAGDATDGTGSANGDATGSGAGDATGSGAGDATGSGAGDAPVMPKHTAAGFRAAWAKVRERIVFTTHTPVLAGNEAHGYRAMFYTGADLGFTKTELKLIGGDPFNMTVAGLRLSRRANAVAELHAQTANAMWAGVRNASKIIAVTNGVHNGTWQDAALDAAAAEYGAAASIEARGAAGKRLWKRHEELKERVIEGVATRSGVKLDPTRLTVGFARRAAPYKRSDLIFYDTKKIEPLLKDGKLQLVFSGKAHPNDLTGKQIVSNLAKMAARYPESVVFLQNYDMAIGGMLTRGCDIWLNNPVRPQEASGTSGMKAAMNGVPNLSVLDGWWPEGCEHGVNGWQIGDGGEDGDRDAKDAESLYRVLTEEVVPMFYGNRAGWIDIMANSVLMSRDKFSAERMLYDYEQRLYTK